MIGSEFRTSFSSLVTILAGCAPERIVNILVSNDRPMVTESGAWCPDKLYQTLSDSGRINCHTRTCYLYFPFVKYEVKILS